MEYLIQNFLRNAFFIVGDDNQSYILCKTYQRIWNIVYRYITWEIKGSNAMRLNLVSLPLLTKDAAITSTPAISDLLNATKGW